jgi:hypothetical protein
MPGAQEEETNKDVVAWTVFCDGSWGTFVAGAAAVQVAPSKVRTCYAAKLDFSCTNNIKVFFGPSASRSLRDFFHGSSSLRKTI